jgi:hypothetical protein
VQIATVFGLIFKLGSFNLEFLQLYFGLFDLESNSIFGDDGLFFCELVAVQVFFTYSIHFLFSLINKFLYEIVVMLKCRYYLILET